MTYSKSLFITLVFVIIANVVNAQISAPDKNFINEISNTDAINHSARYKGSKTFVGENYDLKYHRFYWEIDPAVLYIKGSVTSYFKTLHANVNQIEFELVYEMDVDSIIYHHNNLTFTHDTFDVVTINLGTSLGSGVLDSLTIYYKGVPGAGSGFGAFIKDTHGSTPIIWTLSQPYGTKEWWPCKNDLSDKIDSIDVIVKTPNAYRAASNGLLVNEITVGSDKIYHWKHRYPIATYLIAVAVTNYSVYSDYVPTTNDSIEILNYVFPENLSSAQSQTSGLIKPFQLYNQLFGLYPFHKEKYGHAQFGWGGGMEHQTMSFMGGFSYELVVHELAHQWFGDYITCANWHDIWLNEGFATYLTGLCYENLDTTFGYWDIWKQGKIDHVTSYPDGSVYVYDTTSVWRVFSGRLSYSKGAMVLHMLRWTIGDSAFFSGIRNYLNDQNLAFGIAETKDLKSHLEASSNKNLTEFFDDWLYNEGYPIYQINIDYLSGGIMDVTINQTQSHSSVSFFEMPVPIQFKNSLNDTSIIFDNTFSGQNFLINLGFTPDMIIFDPDNWIVSKLDTLIIGVKEIKLIPDISVLPNPTTNKIYIESGKFEINKIELINSLGSTHNIPVNKFNFGRLEIDLSEFESGVYFLRLNIDEGILTKKIIKL
ncbi:MAG: T9SS type A sorting domain-containing protein [Saprospiraceae bacterium]|nr:T9SS type A sorting domain-containing protein [Saprospiraceae bacterium]